jgi:hypothetical protein
MADTNNLQARATFDEAAFQSFLNRLSEGARKALLGRIGFLIAKDAKVSARGMHAKARRPSTKGGGFWAKIAGAVSYKATTTEVTIGAAHYASAHKQFGGRISAPGHGPGSKNAKFLTIPVNDKAFGFSVGELSSKYHFFRIGMYLCAEVSPGSVEPFFLLKKSVVQKAYPWWPTRANVYRRVAEAVAFAKLGK